DTFVYWSNGPHNQVIRMRLSGGSAAEYFTGDGRIAFLALQGTRLFATDYAGQTANGNVVVGPSGGNMSTLIFPGEHGDAGIAVANDTVYWGTSSPNALAFALQVGNVPVTRIPVGGPVDGVAVDPQGLAYFIVGAQTICRLDVGSTQPQTIYDAGAPFGV